ncbi:MAG: 4Fe-4S dicluster domain-containing protein [Acidobacteriota bacterium]
MNYGFVIDNRKCIGCHACTVACKSEHDIPVGVNRTHVKYVERGVFPDTRRTFTVTRCNHCEDAPCVTICPTSSLFKRVDGIVDFDSDRCIGCRSCMQACPYDALYIDPATHTAAKCNYCAHRIEYGYEPACVIVCPVEAIVSGDLDDPESKISRLVGRERVSVRKPEKGTVPNVFYVGGDYAALDPSQAQPLSSYLFTNQAAGVGHHAEDVEDSLSRAADEGLYLPVLSDSQARSSVLPISQKAIDDVKQELETPKGAARRVYDAPDKGVLWGWQVPAYIWTKAVATGTFLMMAAAGIWSRPLAQGVETASLITCLLFLVLTGALLIHDLNRPDRFLYVLLRPNWTSWLVRGAYILLGFGAVVALMLLSQIQGWPTLAGGLRIPGFILALLGSLYTAFLFAQAKGRDLWQSALAPVRMFNQALMAGSVTLMLLQPALFPLAAKFLVYLIGLNLAVLVLEVTMPLASAEAAAARRILLGGECRFFFLAGLILGSVLPLIVFLWGEAPILGSGAGVLVLAGIFLTEYAWVRAPQLFPLS